MTILSIINFFFSIVETFIILLQVSLLATFFLTIIVRSTMIRIKRLARFAALMKVTIYWISLRSLSTEWRNEIVVILKLSYKESKATTSMIPSHISLCSITTD